MRPVNHPQRSKRSFARWLARSPALSLAAMALGGVALIVAVLTAIAIANPDAAAGWLAALGPTPTLFVLNPSATPDPRGTLPPTWTPTNSPRPPASAIPSRTPTQTLTPTATTTRVPTLTFTPVNTVPAGWYEFLVPDAELAIQFANTWSGLILTDRDPGAALAEINQRDPGLAASVRDGLGQVVLDNLILIAFDTVTANDLYVVNLNIAYADPAEGTTIDEVRDLRLQVYDNSEFYEVIGADSTTVDSQPAHRIRYTTTFAGEVEGEEETTTIYHLEVISEGRLSRDPLLLITLSTSEERRNVYEALLDRIVATLRFTR
jgi:hypothetical protein